MKFKVQVMNEEGKIVKEGFIDLAENDTLLIHEATDNTKLLIITDN